MITYSNLNFPENGHPMWLSINLQRIDQWSMLFQLQGLTHQAVEMEEAEWLFLGDRFLDLENTDTQQKLAEGIRNAKHVVINDLVHNYEGQLDWVKKGIPDWMPSREYLLVTNSRSDIESKSWLRVYRYDFLFNRTKAYYTGFPFTGDPWYFAGRQNYFAPCVKEAADSKGKIFVSPCRLYLDQKRTLYRKKLFDLMTRYSQNGYRSGPGRVKNGAWDKSDTGLYLASSADDPFINYRRLGWGYDPVKNKIQFSKKALSKWRGSRWGGYNPVHNKYYEDTFISIYAETLEYGSNVVITEKTYEPLVKGHFILPFGSCGLIAAIQELGFSLPGFIDYGYDSLTDDDERYRCYSDEVKRLMRFPIQRWRTLWTQSADMLRHNQRLFNTASYDRLDLQWQPIADDIGESTSTSLTTSGCRALVVGRRQSRTKRIGFIGLGKLGLPCAEAIAEHHCLEGFDIRCPESSTVRTVSSIAHVCIDKDVIFIAVPTPHASAYGGEAPSSHLRPRDFDYSIVKRVLSEVCQHSENNPLVVVISTVLPGSVRAELKPLTYGCRLIYNPYLIAMGSVRRDMVNPEMLIIGTENGAENEDVRELLQLYEPVMQNNPRVEIGTWEEAECIKIFYNTFISTKISIVNMIQDVAERIGSTNVDIVTGALMKSHYRITGPAYMTAGMGDGGACHPRDNIALRWLAARLGLGYDLFQGIIESREMQALNLANRLIELASEYGVSTIWIHGKAYKPLVSYTQGSYSLLVAHFARERGGEVQFVDPLTGDAKCRIGGVVLLAHSASVTYQDNTHSTGAQLYCEITPGSVIVDPWRMIRQEDVPGCTIVYYGNTRH